MKTTTLKYAYNLYNWEESHQCVTSSSPISENEIESMKFEYLVLDSMEIFPLYVIKNCHIKELHLHSHIDMSDENFEILYEFEKNGTEIIFHREGYEVWFTTEKRMKTIDDIMN